MSGKRSSKYGGVGIIIHKDSEGRETYSEPKPGEEPRGKVVAVLRNASTKAQHIQNVGTRTDIIMAPGSVVKITAEDEIRGVPGEIKGTGVKKEKYDREKHNRPNPMTGGMPGMEPVDARQSLPEDHAARQELNALEQKAGRKLIGMGSESEVKEIIEEVKDKLKDGA